MIYNLYWPLCFGFLVSTYIRVQVSQENISGLLGKNNLKENFLAIFFGAVSSSCSYAAASMSKNLFQKGATWQNSLIFLMTSTNMVFEMFVVIAVLLGRFFFYAELIGALIMVICLRVFMPLFFNNKEVDEQQEELNKEAMNHQQMGHGMSDNHEEKMGFGERLSQGFYMEISMVIKEILIGVVVGSLIITFLPDGFFGKLFSALHIGNDFWGILISSIIGALIAYFAYVCSVGNLVIASALWFGGLSVGGVLAFIFSDLITRPLHLVYIKYYGKKFAGKIIGLIGLCAIASGVIVDLFIKYADIKVVTPSSLKSVPFTLDYNFYLTVFFLVIGVFMYFRGRNLSKGMHMSM
ncbi:permease [Aureibacter tunicatorum]